MNFAEVRNIKGQREGQWPIKKDMLATFTEIGGLSYNQNQKPICKCKLTDDMNETHLVTLYVKNAVPDNMLNQRAAFKIYAYDGNYQQKSYVGYAGLWQDKAQGSPQAPPQARQATNVQNMDVGAAKAKCDQIIYEITDIRRWIASQGQQQAPPPQAQGGQPNPNWVGDDPAPVDESDSIPF